MSEIIRIDRGNNRMQVAVEHLRALSYADRAMEDPSADITLFRSAAGFEQLAFDLCSQSRVDLLNQLAVSGTYFSFRAKDYSRVKRFGYEAIDRLGDNAYPSTIEKIMSQIEFAENMIDFEQ